jgi:hypothetical protein|tara:strand:+ start:1416 stop:2012 length:597 start_codon:yes stop_codon:yes gene_type:complete
MKKINLNTIKQPHFIGCWNLEDNNLCEDIIKFFENNKSKHTKGIFSGGYNPKEKKTTDIMIKPKDLENPSFAALRKYIGELHKCYLEYQSEWPFLKSIIKNIHVGSFNIQKYSPGDHFAKLHSERTSLSGLHRLFAWMTYLNDVEDGGHTSFDHYGIKIKPVTGKTLIWPAEWTHVHAGELLKSGTKYIVTGWMHFPD